jgi:iron-sulfur cluster assembly accessory protein
MTTEATTHASDNEVLHDIGAVPTDQTPVSLTQAAASKITDLLNDQDKPDLALRVAARAGGCSGMQYQLFFDDERHEADHSFELHGVPVVIDHMSGPHLVGATIDFLDSTEKQGFTIENPNAEASSGGGCGCGSGGEQGGGGGGGCGCGSGGCGGSH